VFRALVFAGGTTMAVVAVVLIATIGTGRSTAPSAVSATTVPGVSIEFPRQQSVSAMAATNDMRVWRSDTRGVTRSSVLAISGAPNAIAAAPIADPDINSLTLAVRLPGDDDRILVLTKSHTYRLWWSEIDEVRAPDDAIVMTSSGALVAVFVNGELRLLVDA
jgi:hypothetical protein